MSVHARTGGVWRTIKNIQMRTSGVWRMQKNLEVRTGGVWRNLRPTTYSSLTVGTYFDGKVTYHGYGDGSTYAFGGSPAYGSLASPDYFGGVKIISVHWISTTSSLNVRLGAASLGAAFIGSATYGANASSGTPSYTTGTGYSNYTFTMGSTLGTGSAILTLTGP